MMRAFTKEESSSTHLNIWHGRIFPPARLSQRHDVYGKLSGITGNFTNKRERKILSLPLGAGEDAERFLNYFRMRFMHREIVKYEQHEPTVAEAAVTPVLVKLPDMPGSAIQKLQNRQ